jgi:ATP-dependent DNA ligase
MVSKNDFSPVEWKKLVQAPLLAGFAVTAADPSSFVGTLQEAFASAKELAEAKAGGSGELVKTVAEEILSSSGRAEAREGIRSIVQGAKLEEIKGRALAALKETAAIVNQKAPSEAKAFNGWLAQISRTVAEAGTEGGFLGFGGVKVSDAEKATLSEISEVLGA